MSLRTLTLSVALWACTLPAAWAGNLGVAAYQDQVGQALDSSPAGRVQVTFGQASASAARDQVSSSALGKGASVRRQVGGVAGGSSGYTLWDMALGQAVSADLASQVALSFQFTLLGHLDVGPSSPSMASTAYQASLLVLGAPASQSFGTALTVSYGPVQGGKPDYARAGDLALEGDYRRSFSALHQGATGGVLSLSVSNEAGNDAMASSTLSLDAVQLLSGPGGMPLGIRFNETGEIMAVTAVPEPAAAWMLAAGVPLLLVWRRRRAALRHAMAV